MQLVRVHGRQAGQLRPWPLGAVRMTERFVADEARPSASSSTRCARTSLTSSAPRRGWRARAAPDRHRRHGAQPRRGRAARGRAARVRGRRLRRSRARALDELVERLAAMPLAERRTVPGIKPARADVILAGAVVVQTVLEAGGFKGIEVTEAGLREGVFFERHSRATRRCSTTCARPACSTSPRSTGTTTNPHVAHVARLALGLFDELAQAGLHAATRTSASCCGRPCCTTPVCRRLRRPPQALALPRPQRRPAGLHAARGRAGRPGRPLPPQGDARPRPVRRARHGRATASGWTAARRCCAWPRASSAAATSSCARPTWRQRPRRAPEPGGGRRRARAGLGRQAARSRSSSAPSGAGSRSRRRASRWRAWTAGRCGRPGRRGPRATVGRR